MNICDFGGWGVVSGSADVGIVALSIDLSPNMKNRGRYVYVPANDYLPIAPACVVLSSSKDKETSAAVFDFRENHSDFEEIWL